jgi:hypothetical protein
VLKAKHALEARFDRWKGRARKAADTSSDGAVEEHRRFEESLTASGDMDKAGTIRPPSDTVSHDTPPGSDQTAG